MAGSAASLSPDWLGADVEQLDAVATRCGRAGEATGQVARSLRAQVLEQEWASGPFFQAFRASVGSHLLPTLAALAEALRRFGRVVSAQADAQRRISAGESFDLAAVPRYASPLGTGSSRGKAPSRVDLLPEDELIGPLWEAQGGYTRQVGFASSTTEWRVRALGLDGDPGFLAGDRGGTAHGYLYLLDYRHAEHGQVGPADVAVERVASIGANASLGGSITGDSLTNFHVKGHAEAFAGARAGVDGSFEIGGLTAKGSAEAWAGAGIARGVNVGWQEDGSFTVGYTKGVAFGLGGKVSWSVTADRELMESISEAFESVGDMAKDTRDWLTSGWDTTPRSR